MKICYMAANELYVWQNGAVQPLPCQRIDQYYRTLRDLEERHAWKTEGAGAKFQNRENPYAGIAQHAKATITALASNGRRLYYALDLNHETGSIHHKECVDLMGAEGLVLSNRNFEVTDLIAYKDRAYVSIRSIRGEWHIAALDLETGSYEFLTSGDTMDRHPVPSEDGKGLYYDGAGYARNEDGTILGKGPGSIMRLQLEENQVEEILAAPDLSFSKYQEDGKGGYYVMSRPYTLPRKKRANPMGCLLAPYYVIKGLIGFFSAFARMQKENGPQQAVETGNSKKETVRLGDELVDIQKSLSENARNGEKYPGIAPATWKLEHGDEKGNRTVIARGVLDYALAGDGSLYYTNGRHLIHRFQDGRTESIAQGRMLTLFALME